MTPHPTATCAHHPEAVARASCPRCRREVCCLVADLAMCRACIGAEMTALTHQSERASIVKNLSLLAQTLSGAGVAWLLGHEDVLVAFGLVGVFQVPVRLTKNNEALAIFTLIACFISTLVAAGSLPLSRWFLVPGLAGLTAFSQWRQEQVAARRARRLSHEV